MSCSQNKTLLFFTASFPFGNKAETFIETEITYLAKNFEMVYIIPLYKESDFIRQVPENCIVMDVLCKPVKKSEKIRLIFKNPLISAKIILGEMSDKGFRRVYRNKRVIIDLLIHQVRNANLIKNSFPKEFLLNALIYDYWFENSTLALSILKRKGWIAQLVVRGHAFDIYDERWGSLGVPFRNFKLSYIDRLVFISEYGKQYFEARTNSDFHFKYVTSRLGVDQYPVRNAIRKTDIPLIVSVSSVNPHKNVEFIPRLLARADVPLHWVHFGKGSEMELLGKECGLLPDKVQWELKGHVDNCEVIRFYQEHKIDLFLSLSESEGLPVSMMEAQSFGIPIIAVPVGGIPEIVIEGQTGFLFEKHEDIDQNTSILLKALEFQFDKKKIDDFFHSKYFATSNYQHFIDMLCQNKE